MNQKASTFEKRIYLPVAALPQSIQRPEFDCTIVYRGLSFGWPKPYIELHELNTFFPHGNGKIMNYETNITFDVCHRMNLVQDQKYLVCIDGTFFI